MSSREASQWLLRTVVAEVPLLYRQFARNWMVRKATMSMRLMSAFCSTKRLLAASNWLRASVPRLKITREPTVVAAVHTTRLRWEARVFLPSFLNHHSGWSAECGLALAPLPHLLPLSTLVVFHLSDVVSKRRRNASKWDTVLELVQLDLPAVESHSDRHPRWNRALLTANMMSKMCRKMAVLCFLDLPSSSRPIWQTHLSFDAPAFNHRCASARSGLHQPSHSSANLKVPLSTSTFTTSATCPSLTAQPRSVAWYPRT